MVVYKVICHRTEENPSHEIIENKMEIVFITPSIKTGGGNRVFIELANQLCDMHNVSIVYPNNSPEINTFRMNSNIRLECIGKLAKSQAGKIWNLLRCVSYLNSLPSNNSLILTDPIFCLFIPLLKHKKRVRRFIQADDYRIYDDGKILGKGLILKIYKKLCLYSYRQKIDYIFNSNFVYNKFCTDIKRNDVRFKLVHPALNHSIFKYVEKDSFHGCSVCLVVRKHPMKGFKTFVNMYRNLPLEIKSQISRITLISHDDLSEFDTHGMQIVKPTCDEDIARVYQQSDIFISTSWWEGFGLPPLEAMACGCVVITSKSGGVDEFAIDYVNCLMYPPKDELQLSEKLKTALSDSDLRRKLSLQGRETATHFDWTKSATQFINIL